MSRTSSVCLNAKETGLLKCKRDQVSDELIYQTTAKVAKAQRDKDEVRVKRKRPDWHFEVENVKFAMATETEKICSGKRDLVKSGFPDQSAKSDEGQRDLVK